MTMLALLAETVAAQWRAEVIVFLCVLVCCCAPDISLAEEDR